MSNKLSGLVIGLLVIGLMGSLYCNYNQNKWNKELQATHSKKSKTVENGKATKKSEQETLRSLESAIENLKSENQILRNNDKETKGTTQEFQERTEKLFDGLTTFDASNYAKRKEACEPYLSKELMKKYFDESLTLGDSNGTDSRLNDLHVYGQVVQGETMKGLVVSRYESRISDSDWHEGTDFYEVDYDTASKKITKLEYVGKGITGGLSD